ncbi:MAG: S8 family serine peptidase, partial [Myxococcota bacterium]
MRMSPVPAIMVALIMNGGCELVEQVLLCDPDLDGDCEDPSRGQLSGQITVPASGAMAASPFSHATAASDRVNQAREALISAHDEGSRRSQHGLEAPRHKLRVPQVSSVNHASKTGAADPKYRAGEVIVRTRDGVPGRADKRGLALRLTAAIDGQTEVHVRLCNTEHLCLAELRDRRGELLDELSTLAVVQTWSRLHEVLSYAEPNRTLQMSRTPNDQYYPLQWHYSAMRLPAAWDITTGHPDVVAAVIDTGILSDHRDLIGRVIGGADLIDDPGVAADGDGRDEDGYDVGDTACVGGCPSHHGTHVAGTMAASTDNADMVAGVSWEGSLLSVRALGKGGGSLFDIVGGIYWALGSEVEGVTTNPLPADVLNLSLGGSGQSDAMDEAVAAAIATGAIVVVAAGNEARDAAEVTPANAPGAITVAALGNRGDVRALPTQASYSNFGSLIDIAAPGGEQAEDVDGDGFPDGVLSTVGDDVGFYQG